jgi:hypothetical protein
MVNKENAMHTNIRSKELTQIFHQLWGHVRAKGQNVAQAAHFGGIWSAEGIWELDGVRVMMSDGGYGETLSAPGLHIWMQYSGGDHDITVHFSEGVQDDLMELYDKLIPAPNVNVDEIQHTGD